MCKIPFSSSKVKPLVFCGVTGTPRIVATLRWIGLSSSDIPLAFGLGVPVGLAGAGFVAAGFAAGFAAFGFGAGAAAGSFFWS